MKIAFFDTKSYDTEVFEPKLKSAKIRYKFYDTRLDEDDVILAKGCDAVCVFVNDVVNRNVIDQLSELVADFVVDLLRVLGVFGDQRDVEGVGLRVAD